MKTAPATAQAWYREPWPWLLAAVPIATVFAGFITLWLAIETHDGLVAEDYYKQGLAINQDLKRQHAAESLGLSAQFRQDDSRAVLTLSANSPRPPAVVMRLTHPTRIDLDRSIILRPIGPGVYEAALETPLAGQWKLSVEDQDRSWRLDGVWNSTQSGPAGLRPGL